jgi:Fic family protein
MIKDIETFLSKYQTDKRFAEFIDKQYQCIMITQFILSSNRIEMVGTQTLNETVRLLNARAPKKPTIHEKETLQTQEALQFVESMFHEFVSQSTYPGEVFYLTENLLLETHQIMMKGLCEDVGRYRTRDVGTFSDFGFITFENAHNVPARISGLVDNHNNVMYGFKAQPPLIDIIKISAKWLHEFLRIHPFVDGNGRVARLWMAYMLRSCIPFMVSILPGLRSRYILALQDNDIKALECVITESLWRHTKNGMDAYTTLIANT